jgi:hypothetical protein
MNTRGNSLVGLLVTLAIICILMVVVMKGSNMFGMGGSQASPRADGRGTTVPGLVKANAQDEVCRSNLTQLRQSLQITSTTEDRFPASLEDTHLGATFYKCPMGGEPYDYNPATGEVHCRHPGHEKF